VIVVVLSVTPEKLRGELTRWLLEISTGVYVGHLSARVRDRLWERIVDDVSKGRALMVWSTRNEQRMQFKVHNHSWTVEDFDGLNLMRRETPESLEIAKAKQRRKTKTANTQIIPDDDEREPNAVVSQHWSRAGRRRNYRNIVEQRRHASAEAQPEPQPQPSAAQPKEAEPPGTTSSDLT